MCYKITSVDFTLLPLNSIEPFTLKSVTLEVTALQDTRPNITALWKVNGKSCNGWLFHAIVSLCMDLCVCILIISSLVPCVNPDHMDHANSINVR
jgi:hypothetical protein